MCIELMLRSKENCLKGADPLSDGILRVTTRIAPSLRRESLIVVRSKFHTQLSPSIEVVLGSHSPASRTLVLTDRNVLPEGRRTLDRGLVDLLVLPDVVVGAVAVYGSNFLPLCGALAIAVLLNIVLNERVGRPAVDGDENRAGGGRSGTREIDVSEHVRSLKYREDHGAAAIDKVMVLPGCSLAPTFSYNEVLRTRELNRVSISTRLEIDIATSLVVLGVILAASETCDSEFEVRSIRIRISCRGSKRSNGRKNNSKVFEGNHDGGTGL